MPLRTLARPRFLAIAVFAAALVVLGSWSERHTRDAAALTGLVNPGFESGVLNGAPASWTVGQPLPDAAKVVAAEGPSNFATYRDMGNVTITPNKGVRMLRLGTPKRVAESQNKGLNSVSQSFTASSSTLKFSFRLFSWEHRGSDQFRFDLKRGNQSVGTLSAPLSVAMAGGTRTCTGIPCQFNLDVGSRGQYLDSGWREIQINNVPTGVALTLSYGVGGTGDQAHGTWGYFDNVNSPPVSTFSFSPTAPREGSFIQFSDRSYDPDPEDRIVAWSWNIDGEPSTERNPFAVLPDEGTYAATLQVTSSDGTSTTVAAGQNALDGTPVAPLIVSNASPVITALNAEKLAGEAAPLVGRFADTGWLDTHTATWSVGGGTPVATLVEDNLPAMSTGLITSVAAGGSAAGTLTVRDADGGETASQFQITVVPNDPERFEPNDDVAGAEALATGGSYLSHIQSRGDVDVYEVTLPGGGPLPAGSEVLATLTGLPADYDLVVLAETPSGPSTARFAQSDFGLASFEGARFAQSRFAQSRFAQSRFAQSRFAQSGFGFTQIPLSALAFTGVADNEIGGRDISLDELGLGGAGSGIEVAGFSANRGLTEENALARADVAGTRFFVAVFGSNGARSAQPYRLQLESSTPPDLATALGAEACTGSPVVPSSQSTGSVNVLYSNPGDVKTLFVTQRERMRAIYSMDDAAWNGLQSDLVTLAQHPSVAGQVISIPSTAYDDWDRNPCSIDAANAVASTIFDEVQERMGGVEYVVFVGDDQIVPYKRVPDETVVSNERDYAIDAFLKPGSPLLSSILQGYNLTDDYYVDAEPSGWQGRELYVPDRSISRLVETPAEIRGQASAFVASNGLLNPETGFVSGYDFFQDGSQETADALASELQTTTLINDNWTADQLRCRFLNIPSAGSTACSTADVSAVNAHFTHYAGLSANGFATGNFNDVLTSENVASAGGATPVLNRRVVFSMGCHAGLSVPDRQAQAADAGAGVNPALDFPEAMALQRAIYIASTGFGLGDDEGIGGTEKLLLLFSQQLVSGDIAAGSALLEAKQQYLNTLSAMTVYDEKSSIQTILYGLPMYRVSTGAAAPLAQAQTASVAAGSVAVTLNDGASSSTTVADLDRVDTPSGSYFTAADDSQATAGRAVQPRMVLPVAQDDASPVHGALLRAGTYADTGGFNPVITRPTTDWEADASEAQVCFPSFWPSELGSSNTLDTGDSLRQAFIAVPGQFRCTSGQAAAVRGVQRTFSALTFELLRCASTDTTAPTVRNIELRALANNAVGVTVTASDESGIARIVLVRFSGGTVTPTDLSVPLTPSGTFSLTVPNVAPTDELVVQVQDGACNVTTATAKGGYLSVIPIDAGPDQVVAAGGAANNFPIRIANFNGLTGPVAFDVDFGDDTYLSGTIKPSDVTIDGTGTATFTVQHTYDGAAQMPLTVRWRISDADGGIGIDDLVMRRDALGDAASTDADFVGGGTSNTATKMTIAVRVAGSVSTRIQYRFTVQVGTAEYRFRYDNGTASGLSSLVASVSGGELLMTFNLAEVGADPGEVARWAVEAQSGVPGAPGAGFPDRMPDAGFIAYTVE